MTVREVAFCVLLPIVLTARAAFAQAPAVNAGGIVNHFSQALAGMPNASIAQGSLFDINGKNLGPADPVPSTDAPVATSLAGVSVQVAVGGKITDVPLMSVSAAKIVGLLPSSTPLGTGTLTVAVNGVKSATAPITVVKTSVGIQTLNNAGSGAAAMTMPDGDGGFIPNSQDATIQPGQTAVFLGTGAGPVSFDETTGAPMQELDLEIHAYVGGKEAQIAYKGRAPGQVGIDEFDVIVPDDLAGCNVSVVFVTGSIVSNFTSISVGDGGPCPSPKVNNLPTEGFLRSGAIELVRSIVKLPPNAGALANVELLIDSGTSAFSSIDYSKVVFTPQAPAIVVGPCIVNTLPPPPQANTPNNSVSTLDAGTVFTVQGPKGVKSLAKQPTGFSSILAQDPVFAGAPNPGPPYIVPGTYTFDNGAGGKDIGAFTATYNMAQPMVWTNADALTTSGIVRSEGLELTWTPGADPDALISVAATSKLANSQVGGLFSCTVKEGDGHFTVPPIVLMVLPPSATVQGTPTGTLTVTWSSFKDITLPGIDYGSIGALVGVTRSLLFK
jgi:uncharacterized protein (TIGR03437 family)